MNKRVPDDLTEAVLKTLGRRQTQSLTQAQLRALTTLPLSNLRVEWLTLTQLHSLLPAQWRALTAEQILSLTDLQLQRLTQAEVRALTPEQLGCLSAHQMVKLPLLYFHWMNPRQLKALRPEQFLWRRAETMPPAPLLSRAQLRQVVALKRELVSWMTIDMPTVTQEQLQALSPALFAALPAHQVSALSETQMRWLTEPQLLAMTPHQVLELAENQLEALRPALRTMLLLKWRRN